MYGINALGTLIKGEREEEKRKISKESSSFLENTPTFSLTVSGLEEYLAISNCMVSTAHDRK